MAKLSSKSLAKNDWRIPLFIEKVTDSAKNGTTMELADGSKSQIIPQDDNWIKVLNMKNEPNITKLKFLAVKKKKNISVTGFMKTKEFGGGGGSGAGAAATKLGESAQCLYCDTLWQIPKTTYSPADLEKTHMKRHTITDQVPAKAMWEKLDDSWARSSILSAEIIHTKLKGKNYDWHRGSALVDKIEVTFKKLNKESGSFFSNINKWTPADIWASSRNYVWNFQGQTLLDFNKYLLDEANAHNLVGISLKKTTNAQLKYINYTKERRTFSYGGHTAGKRGFFSAKDVYIDYGETKGSGGSIQYRTFGETWQGEIKGKTANHGKVSGGPTRNIFQQFGNIQLTVQNELERRIAAKDPLLYEEFFKFYLETDHMGKKSSMKFGEFVQLVNAQDTNWYISKFLGAEACYYLGKATTKEADLLIGSIIQYAASESELSAPYMKVM